jgi:hypothetical protein
MWLANKFPSVKRLLKENAQLKARLARGTSTQRPRITIIPRQTLDWQSMTLEKYRTESEPFRTLAGLRAGYLTEVAELWDSTFAISYFSSRQQMKAIAQQNLCSIPGVSISTDGVLADSDIGCPVDDDDWYSPELPAKLLEAPPADAYVWNHLQFGFCLSHPLDKWTSGLALLVPTQNYSCWTNNYAVSGRLLSKHPQHFLQHFDAGPALRERGAQHIAAALSVANNHPACSTFPRLILGENLSRDGLITAVSQYLDMTAQIDISAQVSCGWAIPQMRSVRSWFLDVRSSVRPH